VREVELRCVECDALADAEARGWRVMHAKSDDPDIDVVVGYCPTCAEREFGPLAAHERRPPPSFGLPE
jgi:hypothetical protein